MFVEIGFNNYQLSPLFMGEPKYRRMSAKAHRWLVIMLDSGEWRGSELASLFGISRSRVSQIKSDHLKEGAIIEKATSID